MKIRTIAAATLCACAVFSTSGPGALAQTAPPAVAAQTDQGDPPGRIARLNYMAGTVTTEPAGASDWSYAQINRPLTTGDQLWNDENARSELHIGSTAVRLGSSTALSVLALDDATAQLKIAQGTLSTRVRDMPPGSTYEIDTPNLALAVTTPGDVRVDVAPDGRATTVTVRSGGATAYGDGAAVQLAGGQQVTFEGTNLQQASANAAPAPDAFDQWSAGRDANEDRSISARYVSRDIPGYQDLDANGTWRTDPSYGAVWVPNAVSADWAPYRAGHWAWQAPWGWTWIDDAPWGFAPYHYGRWAYVGTQWAWVPGPMAAGAPPAYAPALVGFVGDGGSGVDWNVALTVGGVAAAGLAWFPLAPGEAWHPHRDGWSPRYYERVNRSVYVHNTFINYRAPRGLTALPANAFVHGQPVGRRPYAVDPSRWRNPRFFAGAPGIAPTRDSFAPGARRADYRPPQGGFARPVVATRAPVAPPAFHDRFAQQGGGHGAGAPRVDNVRLVATHGPARAVIAGGAGNGPGGPNRLDGRNAPHAPTPGSPQRPAFAAAPGVAQPMQAAQPHGNNVPRPPQQAQFGGDPRFSHGDASHGRAVPNDTHGRPSQQVQVQAFQHGAPPTQAAPQQQQRPPDAYHAYHQAHAESPHAQMMPAQQPRHEMPQQRPQERPQQEAQRPQFHQEPQRQPMHQEARQAPPQMQHQEPRQAQQAHQAQPHQPPQQAQQPQQQRGGNGNDHRG
ncbi:DUF6600 domain-containing protein [Caballeronia insecticola]|uniref:Putative prolin-rich transmembrane protein n=1 Tax=Caballeronia insecticola TaxID=758793 RepID=R4WHS6_9BURK|nr:DUF6600 domain-containing protein [Caballeronia insecticola]BAN23778.1 putative prolin-rich transmembrane protein [Caballeronia insecticola]